jgi:hypothetical protein
MAIEGLTKEEAQKKLDENKAISAQLKSQIGSSKEMILTMAIKSGESDAGLINLGFDQVTIDTFREKIKIGNLKEELKKTIAEQAEETKKTNEEQAEVIKQSIEEHLEKKEAEEEARNASTLLGKKLRKVGLKEKDFESIPEWATLTEPQKMLVIEQASQQIFVDVKKEGEKRFNEKNKINGTFNVFKWRPSALGKVWKKIWKSSYVNSQSKEALEDFRSGKLKPDEEVLGALTKRMSELNLKVIDNAGKPSIEFIQIDPAMSPEVKEAVEKYNEKANEFSKMPDSWKNERAAKGLGSEKNYDKYILLEHEYNEAKKKVIDLRAKKYKDEGMEASLAVEKAQTFMCEKDYKISMMQFTNTSPDAILEMEKLQESSSWKKLANNENLWRASYMGLGYASRWALRGFATLAGPITAATIGALRAKRKAEQKINKAFSEGREGKTFREMTREERMLAREKYSNNFKKDDAGNVMLDEQGTPIMANGKPYQPGQIFEDKNSSKDMELKGKILKEASKVISGKDVNAREVAGFIDADSQIQRLENILNKIGGTTNPGEKARLILELERRSNYIRSKLEEGLINYGTNNPVGINYEMLRLLSKAAVEIQANKPNFADIPDELIEIKVMSMDGSSRMEKRQLRDLIQEDNRDVAVILERLRQKNEIGFDDKQAAFKKHEIIRGALVAATFSGLAYEIRDIQERLGLTINWSSILGHHQDKVAGAIGMTKVSNNEMLQNLPSKDSVLTSSIKDTVNVNTVPANIPDSAHITTQTNLNDTLPPTPKAEVKVPVDDQPTVKADGSPKIKVAPKLEKVADISKSPVVEDNFNKNIKLDDKDIISTAKISTESTILDESAIKTENVDFQEGVNTENVALNGTELNSTVNNESIDLSGAHQVTGTTAPVNIDTVPTPKVEENDIDLSGARKISGPSITAEKVDEYGLGTVTKTETPIIMDNNVRPTQPDGFSNEGIGSGKIIKPTEAVGGYNTGEETGNVYPRSGAIKGGPNPGTTSREVPMTDREAIFTNKGNGVYENAVNNSTGEGLPIESDPRHLETAREIRQTFGNKTVLIDKPEYPTIDDTKDGLKYDDWNTANDQMFEQKGLNFDSYEDFNKERELQQLFGTNVRVENVPKVIYDPVLGRNVPGPDVRVTQEYFRPTEEWKIVEKIPAKYFMQEDFLNGNNLPKADLDKLVRKGIISQNPLTGTYSFSHRNEVERLSGFYKKLVGSKDYEKFVDKVEHTLGNEKPIGNENTFSILLLLSKFKKLQNRFLSKSETVKINLEIFETHFSYLANNILQF